MTLLLQHYPEASSPERREEILRLAPWFQNLHLPDGSQTAPYSPLGDYPMVKWRQFCSHIPERLDGWSVLDIGCNAGFYSFEMARRGAEVLGIDSDARFLKQAQWAAREFGLQQQVRFEQRQVYDLARSTAAYDLVLFLGVLYHLRYPMLALDIVARLVRRTMVFQTLTSPGEEVCDAELNQQDVEDRAAFAHPDWPKIAFIENTYVGDPTNWWAPNHAAVEAMLRSTGMRVTARPGHEIYLCEPDPTRERWGDGDGAAELSAATGQQGSGSASVS